MKVKPRVRVILLPIDHHALEGFIEGLNVKSKFAKQHGRDEQRRLVEAWRKSGPNVAKLFKTEVGLQEAGAQIYCSVAGTTTAQAQLVVVPNPVGHPQEDELYYARAQFLRFLLHPDNERLAGPCPRCKRYFLKKTDRNSVIYCSEKCSRSSTSRTANQKRRHSERQERVAAVRESITEWRGKGIKLSWREWVLSKPGITKTFITRLLHSGEVVEPTKEIHRTSGGNQRHR